MGGSPKHPTWYLNVAANPDVWVRDGADLFEATATTLEGEARDLAWNHFKESWSVFAGYEKKTDRVIPVVRLARKA